MDGSSDSLESTMHHSDSGEAPDEVPNEMPAQGGLLQPSAEEERKESDSLETEEPESGQEYLVESILGRRMDSDGTP